MARRRGSAQFTDAQITDVFAEKLRIASCRTPAMALRRASAPFAKRSRQPIPVVVQTSALLPASLASVDTAGSYQWLSWSQAGPDARQKEFFG